MCTNSSFLIFFLLLCSPVQSFAPSSHRTLISLFHSLLTRVADARKSRGDLEGAARAYQIADKIRFIGRASIWAVALDFAWNYDLQGEVPSAEIYRASAGILSSLAEVSRLGSGAERANWAIRNYKRLLELSNSLFQNMLRSITKKGALREAILVVQREVVEGELLKDCLEVGAKDLDGLIRIANEMYFSLYSGDRELQIWDFFSPLGVSLNRKAHSRL